MIVVHHLDWSRSQRVLWLLEELGLDYQVVFHRRDPASLKAPPELAAVHRLGKAPVIVDNGLVVAESGAIVEYLVESYGGGRLIPPAATAARLSYRTYLHYAEGSAMPPLLMKLVFDRIETAPMPGLLRPLVRLITGRVKRGYIEPEIATQLDFLEAELGAADWFAGAAFSAADIMLSFPLESAVASAGLDGSRPGLMAFLARIQARPAYRRALDRGRFAPARG